MGYESIDEFLETVGYEFLLYLICEYVDNDLEHIKIALEDAHDFEGDIDSITSAFVKVSDDFDIQDYRSKDGVMTIDFEMPIMILASNDDKSVRYSICTCCVGTVEIPDVNAYDWEGLNLNAMSMEKIHHYSYLMKIIHLSYQSTEAELYDM